MSDFIQAAVELVPSQQLDWLGRFHDHVRGPLAIATCGGRL